MPLSTKTIERISGPVSMYILKPKENILQRFSGLPIYMLFGDYHESNENMCKEDKSPGTYNIYDIKFLNIFSKLSTPEEPIDFFLEGSDLHTRTFNEPINNSYPLNKLSNIYVECYENRGRKLAAYEYDQKKCKNIKNIRWQSADPRQFSNIKYLDPDLNAGCNYSLIIMQIFKAIKTDNPLSQSEFRVRINNVIQTIVQNYGRKCIEHLINENPASFFYKNIFKRKIFSESSIIMKQLRSLSEDDKKTIKDYMELYFDFYFKKYPEQISLLTFHSHIYNIIKYILNGINVNDSMYMEYAYKYIYNVNMFTKYIDYIVQREMIILDLYTFCRSLKYTKNILPTKQYPMPIIDICYLGYSHVENMVKFLTDITGFYTIGYQKVNIDNKRCIEIEDYVKFDYILDDLKEKRRVNRQSRKVAAAPPPAALEAPPPAPRAEAAHRRDAIDDDPYGLNL
jgi:hypothetical protein